MKNSLLIIFLVGMICGKLMSIWIYSNVKSHDQHTITGAMPAPDETFEEAQERFRSMQDLLGRSSKVELWVPVQGKELTLVTSSGVVVPFKGFVWGGEDSNIAWVFEQLRWEIPPEEFEEPFEFEHYYEFTNPDEQD